LKISFLEKRKNSGELVPLQQQLQPVDHLTEDMIKRITLQYLKGYYKYRPSLAARPLEGGGYLEAKLGVQTADGVIADGFLSYRTADENQFTATFEATSYLKRGEVRYQSQWLLLFLDSLAVGMMVAAVVFALVFALKLLPIRDYGWELNVLGLFGITLLIGGLFWQIIKSRHRYRYIFAVEQFKQYHANEQWVAVAEDVFDGPKDRHLLELKHQCIRNGFGLILVQPDFKPLLVITPARRELFNQRRSVVQFLPQNQLTGQLTRQVRDSATRLIPAQLKNLDLKRYRRSYFYQLISVLIAVAIIGVVFWEAWKKKEIVVYQDEAYIQELEQMDFPQYNRFPEERDSFPQDTLDWPHVQPFIDLQNSYLDELDAGFSALQAPDDRHLPSLPPPNRYIETDTISNVQSAGLIITSQGRIAATYDCSRMQNIREEGDKFLIQDSRHSTLASAVERINQLGFYGFSANALWLRCFSNRTEGYVVFLDFLFEDRQSALLQLGEYGPLLESAQVYNDDLLVRRLQDY